MPADPRLREIEAYLHEKIPLTRSMGVRVETHDDRSMVLTAPLAANHNHLGTAFGGSISALATVAGYALLWTELDQARAHVVIRASRISYRKPVQGDLRARAHRPESDALQQFRDDFLEKKKARMRVRVTLEDGGTPAVEFEGVFVALS